MLCIILLVVSGTHSCKIRRNSNERLACNDIQHFDKNTKMAAMALMPTLYSCIYLKFSSSSEPCDVSKCEIDNSGSNIFIPFQGCRLH